MKTIIEHLDPKVWKWSLLEYRHISEIVGVGNLIFTNIRKEEQDKIMDLGEIKSESVKDLDFSRVCVLDPKAPELLCPEDSSKFDYFLFGGVLGNEPMDGRTKRDITSQLTFDARNIGDKQMSTDTAVLVVHKIIDKKIPFSDLKFKDKIEIELDKGYSNILPYRYLVENGKIILPKGLVELLKEEGDCEE